MKRILLNKQYQFVALVIAAIILLIIVSSFKTDKVTTPVSTIVINCSSISIANKYINTCSKNGYVFKSLIPYNVNSNSSYQYTNNFILILQK